MSRPGLCKFFLLAFANILILNNLDRGDSLGSLQILAKKGVTGKIFETKDLRGAQRMDAWWIVPAQTNISLELRW